MLNFLKHATSQTVTENGAIASRTTHSSLLDWFAQAGALRTREEQDIIRLFSQAWADDPLLALKSLFYFRDVRGGQGERQTFRIVLRYLALYHLHALEQNIHLIPVYGRWDDLYILFGTPAEGAAGRLITAQFTQDLASDAPSLLGKWLKSENTSSKESRALARRTRQILGLSAKEYRQSLSRLRARIGIVETTMSEKRWSDIEYKALPSQAGLKYRQAFLRQDNERYLAFLAAVANGESKINTGALFPYEIVRQVPGYGLPEQDAPLNALWENLPDYIGDTADDALAVVDVSGSMTGLPMDVAVSVGLYLAERNKGLYHNHFLTFSMEPQLVEITGSTFCERVRNIQTAEWGYNTDIFKVFQLVLQTALDNQLPQEQMIKKLFIISDMEFDQADASADTALFNQIRELYRQHGYDLPHLVFWNVDARNTQFPMTKNDAGVQLVSGCSPTLFTHLMKGEHVSAFDLMLEVLNSPRYEAVHL